MEECQQGFADNVAIPSNCYILWELDPKRFEGEIKIWASCTEYDNKSLQEYDPMNYKIYVTPISGNKIIIFNPGIMFVSFWQV